MRSSTSDVGRRISRASAAILVAVAALVAAVVLTSPGSIGLVVALVAAAAVLMAVRSITRAGQAGASANDAADVVVGPSQHEASPALPASAEPVGSGRHPDAVSAFIVSLARRNGGLVDQQLALLDTLELSVEDPVLLADYFKLDHLATRMRRNADSLLVLAGVDRPGMRSPQDIDEVVRAGISEIEDYRRIDVLALDHAQVTGLAATTLGHLVAELLDNATAFSPPEARVRVAGNAASDGYEILVADSGIGISEARLAELNRKLSLPPQFGSAADASIGLTVVSMLASRIGASVSLAASEHGGTVATVHIPRSALHSAAPVEVPVSTGDVIRPGLAIPVVEPALLLMASPVVAPAARPDHTPPADPNPLPVRHPIVEQRPVDVPSSPLEAPSVSTTVSATVSTTESHVPSPIAVEAANAIAKLTLTLSGLPIRPVPTIDSVDANAGPSKPSNGMFWPPPTPRSDDAVAAAPNALSTALSSLQVADSSDPRPVMEAQPDRIGSAMASFASRPGPTWESFDETDRTTD
jgi:signal transduction histidine kinase